MREHFAPCDPLQSLLVDRIIAAAWRLRRSNIIETRTFHQRAAEIEDFDHEDHPHDTLAEIFRNSEGFDSVGRLETRLERSLFQALDHLERLQAKGRNEPNSAVVQITEARSDPQESEAA